MNDQVNKTEPQQPLDAVSQAAAIQSKLRELEDSLDDLQATKLGHQLIALAGQAAVKAGQCEGLGLFETFELSQEREKVDKDARSLLRAWTAARNSEQLERALEFFELKSITGLKASRRLVDYHQDVLGAFEFNISI